MASYPAMGSCPPPGGAYTHHILPNFRDHIDVDLLLGVAVSAKQGIAMHTKLELYSYSVQVVTRIVMTRYFFV